MKKYLLPIVLGILFAVLCGGAYAITSLIVSSYISISVGDSVAIYWTLTPEGLVDEFDGFTVNNGEPVPRGDKWDSGDFYMVNTDEVPVTVEVCEDYADVIVWLWVWDEDHDIATRMETPLSLEPEEIAVCYMEWEVIPTASPRNEFNLPIEFYTVIKP